MICENAADRKIKQFAKDTFKDKYGQRAINPQTGEELWYEPVDGKPRRPVYLDDTFVTHEIKELVPNSAMASRKYMPGVARILFGKVMAGDNTFTIDANSLNKILKIIISDRNHLAEYNSDLNGLSIDELNSRFGDSVRSEVERERSTISSKKRELNNRYTIVRCPTQKDLQKFGEPLTNWCVAQTWGRNNYDGYTSNGLSVFYVCLRDDYQTVAKEKGDNAPLDDYGLSMIAVNVNDDGSLKNCTTRWNHENGGSDNAMTAEELSDLLGVNFYETFKPRDLDDIWNNIEDITYEYGTSSPDMVSIALGGKKMRDAQDTIWYVVKDVKNNRIQKYKQVGVWSSTGHPMYSAYAYKADYICIADEKFTWFNNNGQIVNPPEEIFGNFEITGIQALKSLENSPKTVHGELIMNGLPSLTSLNGFPEYSEDILIYGIHGIESLSGIGRTYGNVEIKFCKNLKSLEGLKTEMCGSLNFSDCFSLQSIEGAPKTCKKLILFRCKSLKSLNGAPARCGEIYPGESGIPSYRYENYRNFIYEMDSVSNKVEGSGMVKMYVSEERPFEQTYVNIESFIDETGHYREIY